MSFEHLSRTDLVELLDDLLARADRTARSQQSDLDQQAELLHELRLHQVELEMQNRELREAQLELEQSRDRYAELYDFAPVAYFTFDERYAIESLNAMGAALLGAERKALLGRSFFACARPRDPAALARLIELSRDGVTRPSAELELEIRGQTLHVHAALSANLALGERPSTFRCALIDISDRKRVEAERDRALAAERILHQRFEALDRLTLELSALLATEERANIEALLGAVAEHALVLCGAQRATLTLMASLDGEPPVELVRTRPNFDRLAAAHELRVPVSLGRRRLGELAVRCSRGDDDVMLGLTRTLELVGDRVALALENARLNRREARERARLALLERASNELASCADLESARNALINVASWTIPAFARCCAVYLIERDGAHRLSSLHADPGSQPALDRLARHARHIFSARRGQAGEVVSQGETISADASSSSRALARIAHRLGFGSLIAIPMRARGRVLGVMCFGLAADDSGARRALRELAARAALALEINYLLEALRTAVQSRDTLLAMVSHDLRSPLNAISLTARSLAPVPPARERRRSGQQLELIQRSVARMSHLVEDLLTAANIDGGQLTVQPSATSPAELVREACLAHEAMAAARGLTLESGCPPDLPEVDADRNRVLQVLGNLLGNALKLTPCGGKLRINAARAGQDVRFCVSDTGPGIPPHQLEQIFVRYWTGRSQRKGGPGLGLGLFIAEHIISAHGGRIWAESTLGSGATFYFTLPVSGAAAPKELAARPAASTNSAPAPDGHAKSV